MSGRLGLAATTALYIPPCGPVCVARIAACPVQISAKRSSPMAVLVVVAVQESVPDEVLPWHAINIVTPLDNLCVFAQWRSDANRLPHPVRSFPWRRRQIPKRIALCVLPWERGEKTGSSNTKSFSVVQWHSGRRHRHRYRQSLESPASPPFLVGTVLLWRFSSLFEEPAGPASWYLPHFTAGFWILMRFYRHVVLLFGCGGHGE